MAVADEFGLQDSCTVFVGAYAYARAVLGAMPEKPWAILTERGGARWQDLSDLWPDTWHHYVRGTDWVFALPPDLVVVAGWRKLVPIVAPTVGFHSAKLPDYPGRAPVPWHILRGDKTLVNTMLWLDDGVDTGDIVDEDPIDIEGLGPDAIYERIGESSARMLRKHWDGLLDGTAPRTPQDLSKRGPLTTADGWARL